jgi:2-hydroxycyclohexanecarboxyl-CoA dehydrogenase
MRGLKNLVAIVTGAAGGIGRAVCLRFIEEGINIIAIDLNREALNRLAADLRVEESRLLCIAVDISDDSQVREAVERGIGKFGKLDILVNNAGWDVAKPFLQTSPELWDKIIAVNLRGPLNLHKAALPHLIAAGGGKVVNVASDAGRVGSHGESVYSACKGGLIAFSKTIARECARDNIKVNVVCPGPTDTALLRSFLEEGAYGQRIYDGLKKAIPLKRLGQPEDIAGLICFLSSDDANFMTGQVISVSGGLTMNG